MGPRRPEAAHAHRPGCGCPDEQPHSVGAVCQHTNRQGGDRPDEGRRCGEQAKFGVIRAERLLQLGGQGPYRSYVGTLQAEHSGEQ